MISLFKHSQQKIDQILEEQLELNYTAHNRAKFLETPKGYAPNTLRITLGDGKEVFDKAKKIIRDINHLNWDWIEYSSSHEKLQTGEIIATQSSVIGLWGLAVSKIVDIIDQKTDEYEEFGYSMGATKYHVLEGEETFLLRYYHDTQEVEYIIHSYSKPKSLLAKLGKFMLKRKQKQFVKAATTYLLEQINNQSQ